MNVLPKINLKFYLLSSFTYTKMRFQKELDHLEEIFQELKVTCTNKMEKLSEQNEKMKEAFAKNEVEIFFKNEQEEGKSNS